MREHIVARLALGSQLVSTDPREVEAGADWGQRVLWALGLLAVLVVAVIGASATVPRWWAHRIGDQVDGSITQGTALGLVYGFVFTLLPIVAIVLILRWRRTWKTILVALTIGVLFALPNLMTLSIVLGTGNAAHAGDRTLDVDAPAFRGASLVGAIAAGALLAFIGYLLWSRDRAHSHASRVRKELEDAKSRAGGAPAAGLVGLDATLEGVAAVRPRALDPAHEPALALLGGAVREGLRSDASLGSLLYAVVADGRRGIEGIGDVLTRDVLDEAGVERMTHPQSRVAVRLELYAHLPSLGSGVAIGVAEHAGQVLDVVPVLVGQYVRLREWPAASAELRLQLIEEAEVDVDVRVVRTVERAGRRRRRAAARLDAPVEEARLRRLVAP